VPLQAKASRSEVKTTEPVPTSQRWASSLPQVFGTPEVEVELKDDVLRVEEKIDFAKYGGVEPVYTEYNVRHWARSFSLSDKVDRERIGAQLEDGVLTLTLPKTAEAKPRRIAVG
jgi:HSP20 family molecular chaperone IbpA